MTSNDNLRENMNPSMLLAEMTQSLQIFPACEVQFWEECTQKVGTLTVFVTASEK